MCVSLCEWFQAYKRHVLPSASKVKQKNFWDCWPLEVESTVFVLNAKSNSPDSVSHPRRHTFSATLL